MHVFILKSMYPLNTYYYLWLTENLCLFKSSDSDGHESTKWNPLLLIIPLRLGLLNINPIYIDSLKVCSLQSNRL